MVHVPVAAFCTWYIFCCIFLVHGTVVVVHGTWYICVVHWSDRTFCCCRCILWSGGTLYTVGYFVVVIVVVVGTVLYLLYIFYNTSNGIYIYVVGR